MPPTPIVVLEIDDNTPPTEAPFTNDVSMWSMEHDMNLHTRTAAEAFRVIHESIDESKFRGFPNRVSPRTKDLFDRFVDADEVTWVSGVELNRIRPYLPKCDSEIERTLRMLFDTVDPAVTLDSTGFD
jgi:hypothetical protein